MAVREDRAPMRQERSVISLCIKYSLFLYNFFLFVVGGIALGLGIWILVQKDKVVNHILDIVLDPTIMWLCGGGCFTVIVCFFGCCGPLRENTYFLRIYRLLVYFMLLSEAVLVGFGCAFYFFPESLESLRTFPGDLFREAIVKYRDDPDLKSLVDDTQMMLGCCGVTNSRDGYKDWNKNMYFNCSLDNRSHEKCGVPPSCCKVKPGGNINLLCGRGTLGEDVLRADVMDRIHTDGCLYAFGVFIKENSLIVGGVVIGSFIPQIVLIICSGNLKVQIHQQRLKGLHRVDA